MMKAPPEIYVRDGIFSRESRWSSTEAIVGVVWIFKPDDTLTVCELWSILETFPAHFYTVELLRQGFGFRTQGDSDAFRDLIGERLARFFKITTGVLVVPLHR